VVLFGAGLRGAFAYGAHAAAAGLRIASVVEPMASRRDAFGEAHDIEAVDRHATVSEWLSTGRTVPGAIVATPDREHVEPALAALGRGCEVLLEKPMAPSLDACIELVRAADAAGRQLHVAHVLRCTPFFQAVREVVRSGRLGRVVTVEHRENVDARHMAHSYVRGAYRREDESNPMILAKSSHDLDLLHWILDDPVERLSSFGSLLHFRSERAPEGAPERCTDGCPVQATCPFDAVEAYAPEVPVAEPEIRLLTQLFALEDPPSFDREQRRRALATSPYGRCAFRCDNDVVDHQVVAMELASGASVSFTMHGHSHREGRTLRIDGTRATLRAAFTDEPEITVHPHGADLVERIELPEVDVIGHGGGDEGVVRGFAASLRGGSVSERLSSDGRTSLESHLLGWAAEEARRSGQVVDVAERRRRMADALVARYPPPLS
jgi:predicted dehydrogenase